MPAWAAWAAQRVDAETTQGGREGKKLRSYRPWRRSVSEADEFGVAAFLRCRVRVHFCSRPEITFKLWPVRVGVSPPFLPRRVGVSRARVSTPNLASQSVPPRQVSELTSSLSPQLLLPVGRLSSTRSERPACLPCAERACCLPTDSVCFAPAGQASSSPLGCTALLPASAEGQPGLPCATSAEWSVLASCRRARFFARACRPAPGPSRTLPFSWPLGCAALRAELY